MAETGKEGIRILNENPDISIVLMDIMMPDMDGYEVMRHIRGIKKFKLLPIIPVTAKAMKGDREKCIEAGASNNIANSVVKDQVLSLICVWIYK